MGKISRVVLCLLSIPLGLLAAHRQYGLNSHNFPCENTIGDRGETLFRQLGVTWLRAEIPWWQIERIPGVYGFADVDKIAGYARDNGIAVVFILNANPDFYGRSDHNGIHPDHVADWVAFVAAMVNRYKSVIRRWELWNEPNLLKCWHPGLWSLNPPYVSFVDWILLPGIAAIRASDPTAEICGPDLSSSRANGDPFDWFNYMTGRGVAFDVLTHHQYDGGNAAAGRFDELRAFYGNAALQGYAQKEFWVTETGWPVDGSQGNAAQHMRDLLDLMLANSGWWKKTFWYSWRADDNYYLIHPASAEPTALYDVYTSYVNSPHVTVLSPNGGESWSRRETFSIRWHSSRVSEVRIELLRGTTVVATIAASVPAANGAYSWDIPVQRMIADDWRIRVSGEYQGETYADDSDAVFSITGNGAVFPLYFPGWRTVVFRPANF